MPSKKFPDSQGLEVYGKSIQGHFFSELGPFDTYTGWKVKSCNHIFDEIIVTKSTSTLIQSLFRTKKV
jgi:hypothetical protein